MQQAQQVIQAAQNDLREIQQRQTRISTYLDKAAQRNKEELQQGWATTRMRQNTNIGAAKPLLQQLQAVSPQAAQRLQNAVKAMQATVDSGEAQEFVTAESYSDLAGRMLRHTRAATRQRLPSRRQRRRRVAGDRYHGQPVIGGYIELQRDYRVNKRYREDILEEIRRSNLLEKHRHLLDAYLRRVYQMICLEEIRWNSPAAGTRCVRQVVGTGGMPAIEARQVCRRMRELLRTRLQQLVVEYRRRYNCGASKAQGTDRPTFISTYIEQVVDVCSKAQAARLRHETYLMYYEVM